MIFMLGGSASARLQHTGMIFSYGFFPLALWLLEEALDRRSYGYAVLFAAVAAMMTVGRDQVAFLCALTLDRRRRPSDRHGRADRLAFAARAGSASSRPWARSARRSSPCRSILTMQFLATSTRPSFGFGVAAMGSLPPESLATILFGNVFGSLRQTYDYWGPDWQSIADGTWTDRATNYLFAGTIPALLLLWHGIAGGRLFAREFRFFLVLGIAAVLYALGRYTPVFALVFDHAARRRALPPAGGRDLPDQLRPRLRGRLPRPPLARGGLAEARAACGGRPARRSPALAALAVVALVARARLRAARQPRSSDALRGRRPCGRPRGARRGRRRSRPARPQPAAPRSASLSSPSPAGELIWRNAASPLNAEPAERYAVFQRAAARAAAGPPGPQEGARRAQRQGRAPAGRDPRPRRRLAERLDGARARGHDRLQPAAARRLREGGRPGRERRRPEPAHLPGHLPRLQVPAGEPARPRIPRARPPDRAPAAPLPAACRDEAPLRLGHDVDLPPQRPARRAPISRRTSCRSIPRACSTQAELPDFDRPNEALIDEASVAAIKGDYGLRDGAAPERARERVGPDHDYGRNAGDALGRDRPRQRRRPARHLLSRAGRRGSTASRQPILRANLLFRGVEVGPGRHPSNSASARSRWTTSSPPRPTS